MYGRRRSTATPRLARHEDPADRLGALIDGLIEQVEADRAVFRLYLSLTFQANTEALRRAAADLREPMDVYLGRVREVFDDLGSANAELDAALFRSALLGLCVRIAAGDEELPVAALRTRLLDVFTDRSTPVRERVGHADPE